MTQMTQSVTVGMTVVSNTKKCGLCGRNTIPKFSPTLVDKIPSHGNHSEIVGEKVFAQRLWISANFEADSGRVGRKLTQEFSPTIADRYQSVILSELDWAKFSKTTFRPAPSFVGEKRESPLGLSFAATGLSFGCAKLALGIWVCKRNLIAYRLGAQSSLLAGRGPRPLIDASPGQAPPQRPRHALLEPVSRQSSGQSGRGALVQSQAWVPEYSGQSGISGGGE